MHFHTFDFLLAHKNFDQMFIWEYFFPHCLVTNRHNMTRKLNYILKRSYLNRCLLTVQSSRSLGKSKPNPQNMHGKHMWVPESCSLLTNVNGRNSQRTYTHIWRLKMTVPLPYVCSSVLARVFLHHCMLLYVHTGFNTATTQGFSWTFNIWNCICAALSVHIVPNKSFQPRGGLIVPECPLFSLNLAVRQSPTFIFPALTQHLLGDVKRLCCQRRPAGVIGIWQEWVPHPLN